MKNLFALTLLTAILTGCGTSGEDLQGRFGTPTRAWTMALSTASPSGTRTVSVSDDVLLFEMTLPIKNTLAVGSRFEVAFTTDSDLDPIADGTTVNLKVDGTTVGTGTFNLVDPSIPDEGTATVTTTSIVKLKAGTPVTFTVNTNTASILAEDAGVDDELTVEVEYNGKSVTGNVLKY